MICSSLSYFFSFWFCFCFSFCFWFLFCFWFHLSAGLRHFYQIFTRMRRVTLPHDYVISAHCDASAPVIIFSRTMDTSLISLWKINKTFSVNEILFFFLQSVLQKNGRFMETWDIMNFFWNKSYLTNNTEFLISFSFSLLNVFRGMNQG